MHKTKLLAAIMLAGMFSAMSVADEPPETFPMPGGKGVGVKVPPELDVNQQSLAADTLVKARELRKLSDQGDADATYQFAKLLAGVAGAKIQFNEQQLREMRELSDPLTPSGWLMKAADAGSQPAIDALCKMGDDPTAPAAVREKGRERCKELRAKHPAQ